MKRYFTGKKWLPLLAAPLGLVSCSARAVAVKNTPRVAVFSQIGFPFYIVSPLVSPKTVAADLRSAGVQADLLDTKALSDPARFNARSYDAVVLPYGNTYPMDAFGNLRNFHSGGGSLIMSAVPFTHPVARMGADKWTPNPNWSASTRLVSQAHSGLSAVQLSGSTTDWVGVSSGRQPVQSGQRVLATAWTQSVSGNDGGNDWLYVRFYGIGGSFISQVGVPIPAGIQWQQVTTDAVAPANTAEFDISPQIRTPDRVVRLDDVAASVAGQSVALVNGGFENQSSDWSDVGNVEGAALFGPQGIGVGNFADQLTADVSIAPGDLLGLKALGRTWPQDRDLQIIDVASLPKGIEVKPILLEGTKPAAALLIHRSGPFKGAVDAWTNHPSTSGDLTAYDTEQFLARATIASLAEKGLLSPARKATAFAALLQQPKPKVYENISLPVVPRTYATLQPKMPPPARHLYVADIRAMTPDQQLLLTSLQGIVNRTQPRIYLISGDTDRFWLQQMQNQGSTDEPIEVSDPLSLVTTFRTSIKGAVVPDPKVYISPSIAATFAGLDDVVVATPALAAQLNLPIKNDLRGCFKDDADALHYVRTTLMSRLNPYLSICLDPPMLGNGSLDQIIAAKGLAFWITGPKQQNLPGANMNAELAEIKAIFARQPLNSVVRGFWWHGDGYGLDESAGVSLGSRFGKVTVVSDYVRNFSVLSGVPKASLQQKKQASAPVLDSSKVYIAFTMSDGDNVSTWFGYFRKYFEDPLHGTIPIGWGMAPGLLDVAPSMAQWYYDRSTPNDEFICDVSGAAYIYPPDYGTALKDRPAAMRSFYDWTQRDMQRMGMKTIRLMNVRTEDIPQVGALLPKVPFLMPDYGWSGPSKYSEFTYTLPSGQPVFRAALEGQGQGPQEKANRLRLRAGAARPAFLNAFIWNWGSSLSDLQAMLKILGPEYVAVTPSQLNDLYRQAQARKKLASR